MASEPARPRPSPFRPLPQHDASLLRRLFRGAKFPDSECWRHIAHVRAKPECGATRELTILVSLQLSAAPMRSETATALIAVRDEQTGESWTDRSHGRMSGTQAVRYACPGWLVLRLDESHVTFEHDAIGVGLSPELVRQTHPHGVYVIRVRTPDIDLCLELAHTTRAALSRDGWVDYNPDGKLPLWAAGKLRVGTARGSLRLRDSSGVKTTLEIDTGIAHFEQRCLVPSASLVPLVGELVRPSRSLQTLHELAGVRRSWRRFRVGLGDGVLFFAEQVCDPTSKQTLFQHALVADGEHTTPAADLRIAWSDESTAHASAQIEWRTREDDTPLGRRWLHFRPRRANEGTDVVLCDVELEAPGARAGCHTVGYLEHAELYPLPAQAGR